MHIADGVLDNSVVVVTSIFAGIGVIKGIRGIEFDDIPKTAMLSAAFFVIALIHINIGVSSIHLVLNGMMGILLGWAVFPALAIALALQYLFFGFGGITSLGANIVVMGYSAVICYFVFKNSIKYKSNIFLKGVAVGGLAVILAVGILVAILVFSGKEFYLVASTVAVSYLPVIVVEGLVSGSLLKFIFRVRPEILNVQMVNTKINHLKM